ncbi:MAG: helix-turn-helix transcriptional regulator [Bacteroidales bacterium]|nr:helix-turn-helix transcriptional regulator [Bacteroidales bacterium]
MKERLQTILNLERITAAQLATLLGIQRSTLSNLMSGRNNPSYDFILSVLTKLPNLNIEWLLTGVGQPYRNSEKNFRGESLSDSMTLREFNANNQKSEETNVLRNSDANSSNLFGFPEEDEQDFPFEEEKLQYSPFPPLEDGELAQRLKQLEETVNKDIAEEKAPSEPLESGVNEVKRPSIGKKIEAEEVKEEVKEEIKEKKEEKQKSLERVILFYSDGSFQSFEK